MAKSLPTGLLATFHGQLSPCIHHQESGVHTVVHTYYMRNFTPTDAKVWGGC